MVTSLDFVTSFIANEITDGSTTQVFYKWNGYVKVPAHSSTWKKIRLLQTLEILKTFGFEWLPPDSQRMGMLVRPGST